MCVDERIPLINEEINEDPQAVEIPPQMNQQLAQEGLNARHLIVQQYYQ